MKQPRQGEKLLWDESVPIIDARVTPEPNAVPSSSTLNDSSPKSSSPNEAELDECTWSPSVALDPKHQPQAWDRPSSTVRREWCRYPQEGHILDEKNWRYRKLSVDEIAIIQGFHPGWFQVPGMSNRNRIRAIGDAVPPPLARALMTAIDDVWNWKNKTAIEICAGSGGLASGALTVSGIEHLLLIDQWPIACEILKFQKPWSPQIVKCADAKQFDFGQFRKKVGLLSGGPPCQPWSQGGRHQGLSDERDLLGEVHEIVAAIEPEVFLFENVPGLASEQNWTYLQGILRNLRKPGSAQYGVMAGLLNAADFAVPQIRRRIFLLGFRDMPASFTYRVFDRINQNATHRDPGRPHPVRKRWITLEEAFKGRPDPGGWRHWIK
jgi:site-specific DNA-cytosine methylase